MGAAIVEDENTSLGDAYAITIAGDPPVNLKFAAQPDKNESHLEELNETELHSLGEAAQLIQWSPAAPLDQSIRTARAGTELWAILAMIVLALAAIEPFLGNWFSQSK